MNMRRMFSNWFPGLKPSPNYHPNDPRRYKSGSLIGRGTFGNVYVAKDRVTGSNVAIKKIPDDANAQKELLFCQTVSHRNVVRLLAHYREKRRDVPTKANLCLVMECSKKTLKEHIEYYQKRRKSMPSEEILVYTFQIFRALHYLHSLDIMHRDVKPSNFLLSKKNSTLQICDFGTAERYVPGQPRNTNVCSRPYRAPELELGNEDYNEKIDIWAAGCVAVECFTNEKLFREQANVKHYEIICQVLGDPTQEDIEELLPLFKGQKFRLGQRPSTLEQRLARSKPEVPSSGIAFVKKILVYKPSNRPAAIELCADPFYDSLRRLSQYDNILYDFSHEEMVVVPDDILERVVPQRRRSPSGQKKVHAHHGADAGHSGRTCQLADPSLRSFSGVIGSHKSAK